MTSRAWLHVVLASFGALLAPRAVDSDVTSAVLILASIVYAAWTLHWGGLLVALAAGLGELHLQLERHEFHVALVVACLWSALYLIIAVVTAAVERATRPEPRERSVKPRSRLVDHANE